MFLGQQPTNEQNQIPVSSNNTVLKFGSYGNGNGEFNKPIGIAIDIDNCHYMVHTGNLLV